MLLQQPVFPGRRRFTSGKAHKHFLRREMGTAKKHPEIAVECIFHAQQEQAILACYHNK